jgi:hypothetical protein
MIRRLLPAALAVAAGVALAPAPAQAATATSRLTLIVKAADGTRTGATLTCNPTGGSHSAAAAACTALAAVHGDIARIPAEQAACTMQYTPVTAVAYGHWRGRYVKYRQTFANGCVLKVNTGPVFSF